MSSDESGKEELKYICRECKDTTRVASDSGLKCIHCNSDLVQEIGVNSSLISIPNVTNDSSEEMSEEMKELESEKTCSICLDTIDMNSDENQALINCKHLFHNQCIKQWLIRKNKCPLCREKVTFTEQSTRQSARVGSDGSTTHGFDRNQRRFRSMSRRFGPLRARRISDTPMDLSDPYITDDIVMRHEFTEQSMALIMDFMTQRDSANGPAFGTVVTSTPK